jgi:MFS transporter, DHA1 family, multidrug resistance protein
LPGTHEDYPVVPLKTSDGVLLVDWYTADDPANPQNWSRGKRAFVVALVCLYTWFVYTDSSIYAASELDVMERFAVNPTEAVLPLSLSVLTYGIGPLSPCSVLCST